MEDKKLFNLIDLEKRRQTEGIELIASENYASDEVMAASGSILTCLLYTSPSPRDVEEARMPSSA